MSMSMQFNSGEYVTIDSNDSDELLDVATQIKSIRDSAKQASRNLSREIDGIRKDTSLSDQGRHEKIAELENDHRARRKVSVEREKEIISNKITALERRLDGYVGWSESNIIAFRDAQDRAEAIKDADRAAAVMERALRSNDRTLSHALYRRAVDNGWTEASRAFAKENSTVASLVKDVHKLRDLRDASFDRAVAYM